LFVKCFNLVCFTFNLVCLVFQLSLFNISMYIDCVLYYLCLRCLIDSDIEDGEDSYCSQIISENKEEKLRIKEYVSRKFGDGLQPTLETVEYQVGIVLNTRE